MTTPPMAENDDDPEKDATGTTCDYRRGSTDAPCGGAQYEVHGRHECRRNHQEIGESCAEVVKGTACGARRYWLRTDHDVTICAQGHRVRRVGLETG